MTRSNAVSSSGVGHASDAPDDGFTLAEVVVSIALFIVMSVATTISILALLKLTRQTENRVTATNLARQQIADVRLQNTTGASVLDQGSHVVVLYGKSFTVTTTMTPAADAACATGSERRATVVVSTTSDGAQISRFDTVLAC